MNLKQFKELMKVVRIVEVDGSGRRVKEIDTNLLKGFTITLHKGKRYTKSASVRQADALENIAKKLDKLIGDKNTTDR